MCVAAGIARAEPPAERTEPHPEVTPKAQLETAEADFRELRCREAETKLRRLLAPPAALESPDDRLRARELLAACLWFLGEKGESRAEFVTLLVTQSGHELDKFSYPKPLLDFFGDIRQSLIASGTIKVVVEPPPEPVRKATVLRITEREHSRAATFLPFGMAQFEQDRTGWGAFFATSQGLAALANIGTYAAYVSMYQDGDPEVQQALFISTIATGAAWLALTTWGIVDANVSFEPLTIVRTEEVPAEPLLGGPAAPGPTPR